MKIMVAVSKTISGIAASIYTMVGNNLLSKILTKEGSHYYDKNILPQGHHSGVREHDS